MCDTELEPGTIKDISGKQVKFKQGLHSVRGIVLVLISWSDNCTMILRDVNTRKEETIFAMYLCHLKYGSVIQIILKH